VGYLTQLGASSVLCELHPSVVEKWSNEMATPKSALDNKDQETTNMSTSNPIAETETGVDKRLAITLSERAYNDLRQIAANTSRPMSDVIRIGIGLYKVAAEVSRENNKLMVVSRDGKPLKEIVLPTL